MMPSDIFHHLTDTAPAVRGGLCSQCEVKYRPAEPGAPSLAPDERKCPYCAETIKKEAIICRFCNRNVPALSERPPPSLPAGVSVRWVCGNCWTECDRGQHSTCPKCGNPITPSGVQEGTRLDPNLLSRLSPPDWKPGGKGICNDCREAPAVRGGLCSRCEVKYRPAEPSAPHPARRGMTEREIAAAVGVSGFVLLGVIGFVLLLKVAIGPSKNGVIVREVSSRPAGTTDAETEKGGKTEPLAVPASSQHAAPTKSGGPSEKQDRQRAAGPCVLAHDTVLIGPDQSMSEFLSVAAQAGIGAAVECCAACVARKGDTLVFTDAGLFSGVKARVVRGRARGCAGEPLAWTCQ